MSPKEIKRRLLTASPGGLAAVVSRGHWKLARHLDLLNRKLVAFERAILARESPRLMISMPPRHGKSELVSKHLPPWFLMRNPDRRVLLTSYSGEFAAEWGGKAIAIFEAVAPEHFGLRTNPRSRSADAWDIAGHDGGMRTAGVAGPLTGKGGDLLVIDDSIKDHAQANSEAYRRAAREWWGSTFYTRCHPGGGILLMQTRWHEDDLPGHVLRLSRDGGEPWDVLNLPAIAEEGDLLGRRVGEALWPEVWGLDRLAMIRANMSAYWWAALYQGSPQPAEGGTFKRSWIRRYRTEGDLFALEADEAGAAA